MLTLTLLASALAAPAPTDLLTDAFSCRTVGAMVGPEDYAVLGDGAVLVSANRYRPDDKGESEGIFRLELDTGESTRLPILARDTCSLHPHGISLTGPPGAQELYVVSHYRAEDADNPTCYLHEDKDGDPLFDGVERYQLTPEGLRFVARLQDPLITEPNDVFATPDGQLFVSNNPEFGTLGYLAGALLGWRPSVVLHFESTEGWRVIARRFFYSNGVLLDDRGGLLVSSAGGRLTRLTQEGDRWERSQTLVLHGALDNLMLGDDDRVWVAGHPKPVAFLKHAKDAAHIGPSEAYALEATPEGWAVSSSWIDETGTVNASSTASMLGSRLLLAQVFQPGLVLCERKQAPTP